MLRNVFLSTAFTKETRFGRKLFLWFYLHSVNFGLVNENQIIRKLEMATRPMSPAFPLLSSTESIISKIRSPLRSFLFLENWFEADEMAHSFVCRFGITTYMLGTSNLMSLSSQTWCAMMETLYVKLKLVFLTSWEIFAVSFTDLFMLSVAPRNRNRSAPYNNLDCAGSSRDG